MTTFYNETVTCACCGAKGEQPVLTSTSSFGPPDLDSRPAPMKRYTLPLMVSRCRQCGYAGNNLAKMHEGAKSVIATEAYRAALADASVPDLSRTFHAIALLEEGRNEPIDALFAFLGAAWAADDAALGMGHGDDASRPAPSEEDQRARRHAAGDAARRFRGEALRLMIALHERGEAAIPTPGADLVLRADLLRRTGRFEEAEAFLEALRANPPAELQGGGPPEPEEPPTGVYSHRPRPDPRMMMRAMLEQERRLVVARDDAAHTANYEEPLPPEPGRRATS